MTIKKQYSKSGKEEVERVVVEHRIGGGIIGSGECKGFLLVAGVAMRRKRKADTKPHPFIEHRHRNNL